MVKQQAPAPKPANSLKTPKKGQFIDFRPRKSASKAAPRSTRPVTAPKPQTASEVAVRRRRSVSSAPKPTAAPQAPQAPKSTPKSAPQTASSQPKIRPAAPRPTPPASNQPAMRQAASVIETIETIEAVETLDDNFDEIDSIEEEILEETSDFIAEESNLDEYTDALAEAKKAGHVDSPFLTSVNVDKRPLSSRRFVGDDSGAPTSIKEEDFHGSLRNTYTRRRDEKPADDIPTSVVPTPKKPGEKARSAGLIVAIILTVLLGAGVGAFLYLAFFQ